MNIVDPIFSQCRNKPAELALAAPGTAFHLISYARLERCVNNVCQRILSSGLSPGSRVAVFIDDPILHAITLIALTRLGIVTISGRNRDFSWRFAVAAVIADQPTQVQAGRVILVNPDWTAGDGRPPDEKFLYRAAPDDVCRVFLTYGKSGEEKGLAVTHRVMATRIERQKLFLGPQAPFCARTYLDLPLTTSLGFQVLMATLWRGGALFLPSEPYKPIEALPAYRVQNIVGSAQGLLNLVEMIEKRPQYRCGLEAIFCAGIVSDALSERVRARWCSNLTHGHISLDATMVASMPAHFARGIPGAAGFVLPGVEVEIVDSVGGQPRVGNEGVVRIRSEYGVSEYLDDPEETKQMFRDGWFYSGDRGFLTKDNILIISSRQSSS